MIHYDIITKLKDFAERSNIDITEITVSPALYDTLLAEAEVVYSCTDQQDNSRFRYCNIIITKRKCTGCCLHRS